MTASPDDFKTFSTWATTSRPQLRLINSVRAYLVYSAVTGTLGVYEGALTFFARGLTGPPGASGRAKLEVLPAKFQGLLSAIYGDPGGSYVLTITLSNPVVVDLSHKPYELHLLPWETSDITPKGPPDPKIPTTIEYGFPGFGSATFGSAYSDHYSLYLSETFFPRIDLAREGTGR